MNINRIMMVGIMVVAAGVVFAATPTISNVTAKMRNPWGKVEVSYEVVGDLSAGLPEGSVPVLALSATDRTTGSNYVAKASALSGDMGTGEGVHRVVWDARADLGEVCYTNMVLRVNTGEVRGRVQLWEGGPYWAETNVGAEEPWEYGYYFWWGDTVGYKRENNSWVASDGSSSGFSFSSDNTPTCNKSVSTLQSEGWIDANSILVPEHDAAHIQWGGTWRMPTSQELSDLCSKCDWTWTTINGMYGYVVCGRGSYASFSIFLPATGDAGGNSLYHVGSAGRCWSSVLNSNSNAHALYFASGSYYTAYESCSYGRPVRPVTESSSDSEVTCVGESASFLLDTTTPIANSVALSYDSSWVGGDAGATVVIADNGTEVKRTTGAGEFVHAPSGMGLHELTYTTYIDDVAQEEVYTAKVFKDWKYEVAKGGAVIVGTTQTEGNVVIPSEIDGYSVVGIGPELFAGCSNLTEVVIPRSVRDIGERAFANCTGLRRVEVAKALQSQIESQDVFEGCSEGLEIVYIAPEIRNVVAKPRNPWGKVEVSFEVVGDLTAGLPEWNMPVLALSATDRTTGSNYVAKASALSGDTGTAEGAHRVVWDMKAQGLDFVSDVVVFTVSYGTALYCVIDLSAGSSAASYPVSYLADVPEGRWTDEYKTTKLVLRLIEPGSIPTRDAAITTPFYMGVFEVTQKQYELVTGSNPSQYKGDMRPVEKVSWNKVRGNSGTYNWPSVTGVDPNSFMGRIQARTGLNFDLPTEAQWEYACLAGTTTDFNNGTNYGGNYSNDPNLNQLGRYYYNQSVGKGGYLNAHTTVGSYLPNAWGLYDMHGNVWEWCLDWYGGSLSGNDPIGSSSGSYRVLRGGGWGSRANGCTSSYRIDNYPSSVNDPYGFRLVRTLSQ